MESELCRQPTRIGEVIVEGYYAYSGVPSDVDVSSDSGAVSRVRTTFQFSLEDESVDTYNTEELVTRALKSSDYQPERMVEFEHVEVQERRLYVGDVDEERIQVSRKTLSKLLAHSYVLIGEGKAERDDMLMKDVVDNAELALDGRVVTES